MFKKVQMKFFAIITSILLAVFIALLASVNLIMEAVMKSQSKVVLKQIASSIEYDEKTSSFTYTPERGNNPEPPEENNRPVSPNKQDNTTQSGNESTTAGSTESTDVPATEAQPDSTTPSTDAPTEQTTPSTEPESTTVPATESTEAPTEPSSETLPPVENPSEPLPPPEPPEWNGNFPPKEEYPYFPEPDHNNGFGKDDEHYWHDDGYYYYPMPDERIEQDERYNGSDFENNSLYENEYIEEPTENFTEEYIDFSEKNIRQQSLLTENAAVLNGYSVISNTPKIAGTGSGRNAPTTVYLSDAAAMKNEAPVPKSLGSIDFFVLMADKSGNFIASLNNDTLAEADAQSFISTIIDDGASSGMLNSYQFCQLEKDNGTIMVFTDKSAEIDMLKQLTRTTILIGAISFVVLSLIAFFLSKKSIQPIKDAFEKQKQFVSDASHELKTPLTIISANADVLSDEIGQNKWLEYIKAQTDRMNVLVNDLLNLTRLENNTADFICGDFDLSKAVENTALPFECQAFEMQKKFVIDIQEGLTLNGSERHIKQMIAIFIDNALKYSDEKGTVSVTLTAHGDKKLLSVFNTGQGLKSGEEDKIFERFYRSDDSRARTTGGYGLGLAIAKSIIDKHRFKVSIENHEGSSICFNIFM